MTQNRQNHQQNQNQNEKQSVNTSTFGSPLKKRVAVGAVTAMAAGSLLGFGAVGANAAPLDSPTDSESTTTTNSSTLTEAEQAEATAALAALTEQLQGQLADATGTNATTGAGSTDDDAAQIVTDAIAEHPDLFQSLPVNLQTDLVALGEANSDQEIAADTIETTALSGGYGEQIQTLAEAIQQDPEHPLAAVLQSLAASDAVVGDVAADELTAGENTAGENTAGQNTAGEKGERGNHDRGLNPEKIAIALAENPALFDKLPLDLQTDLTELQTTPEADRAAGADAIKTTALEGGYGEQIRAIAERVVQNFADADADAAQTEAGAEAEAGATDGDTEVKTDADVTAGVPDAN
jgi:hypothetical protein